MPISDAFDVIPDPPRQSSGFTLIEIIVVLAILGLVSSITLPLFTGALHNMTLKSAAHDITNALNRTRLAALQTAEESTFTLDIEAKSYGINKLQQGTFHTLELPDDTTIRLTTADIELIDANTGNIRFFPDGSSTGGEVSLSYKNQSYAISVNWLTGQVTLQ